MRLRVDANRGYTFAGALAIAPRLRSLAIDEWEEPLDGSFEELSRLRSETGLAVILDESVRSRDDLERALDRDAFDVLNIKLARIGGITAALDYRARCLAAGRDILLGCNEDIGFGMAAILTPPTQGCSTKSGSAAQPNLRPAGMLTSTPGLHPLLSDWRTRTSDARLTQFGAGALDAASRGG